MFNVLVSVTHARSCFSDVIDRCESITLRQVYVHYTDVLCLTDIVNNWPTGWSKTRGNEVCAQKSMFDVILSILLNDTHNAF